MKPGRRASRRKPHVIMPKPHYAVNSGSYRSRRSKDKIPRRWRSFYFWLPFYLVFLLVLASVFLGWTIHEEVVSRKEHAPAEEMKGRSGGEPPEIWSGESEGYKPLFPVGHIWGKKERAASFVVAAGNKALSPQMADPDESEADTAVERDETLPPWRLYAVPSEVGDDVPMIAVVIDDLGMNRRLTRRVLKLPAPLTASFLAYADDLPEQAAEASAAGHELLVHTPMEPLDNNPGPGALMLGMDDDEIRDRLAMMLGSFSGYVGINNHMGSRFTADEHGMEVVLDEVNRRGLLFLDSLTGKNSAGKRIAREKGMPYAVRNVFLDNARESSKVMQQLRLLERLALKNKAAVGIGHPHPATIDALSRWIPEARRRGFALVPVSAVVRRLQEEQGAGVYEAVNHAEGE